MLTNLPGTDGEYLYFSVLFCFVFHLFVFVCLFVLFCFVVLFLQSAQRTAEAEKHIQQCNNHALLKFLQNKVFHLGLCLRSRITYRNNLCTIKYESS